MAGVFLSYSRKDEAAAQRLHGALAAREREVWIDREDIPPTAAWWAEIAAAIEAAEAFVFLISPDSVVSRVCADELAHAQAMHKRLVPLVARDVPGDLVPAALAARSWIFLRADDDFDAGVATLLMALDTDLDWVRVHTRLLVRAGDWLRHGEETSFLLRGTDLDAARRWRDAAAGKKPPPAPLHERFLDASAHAEAAEIERLRGLYHAALSRQLAAQAALMQRETDALLDRAMLLAAESMRRQPGAEADRVLREGLALRAAQLAAWSQAGAPALLAVSPCGRWIAGGGDRPGTLAIRRADDGRLLRSVDLGEAASATAFVPGADALVVLAGARVLRLPVADGLAVEIGTHPDGSARSLCVLPGGDAVVSVGPGGAQCLAADGSGPRWRLVLDAEAWVAAADAAGAVVAVGADDCTVRIVDAATGTLRHALRHGRERPVARLQRGASDAGIAALAFAGDPLRLASAGLDGTVRVWDVVGGAELQRGTLGRDALCVALHGPRGLVAGGSIGGQLVVWPAGGGAELLRLVHQAAVTAVAWSDDGRWLLSASGDGCARLWHVDDTPRATEAARCILPDWAGAAAFAGPAQVAAGDDGSVVLFGLASPADEGRDHGYSVSLAACNDAGSRLLLRSGDFQNQIAYDVAAGWQWALLEQADFGDDAFYTDDGALITATGDGRVREFDAATLGERHVQPHPGRVWKTRLAHDQARLATAVHGEPLARVWQRGAAVPERLLPHDAQVRALDFSPDDGWLVTGSDDGRLRVWKLADGTLAWAAQRGGVVWSAVFDATGRRVASVADDADLVVHDAFGGAELHRAPQPGRPFALDFSPDGRWLAMHFSFEGPHEVHLLDARSFEVHAVFGHEKQVAAVAWDAEGTRLATGSEDGAVRVFDVAARREQVRLRLGGYCGSVRWVPQTQRLVACSSDGALRIARVAPLEMVRLAEARVPRALGDAEWRQYLPDEPRPPT